MATVRRLAYEAADCGLLSPELAAGIHRVKGVRKLGSRLGNCLTAGEAAALWQVPDGQTLTGKRNRALNNRRSRKTGRFGATDTNFAVGF
jgi:hypothetical protein